MDADFNILKISLASLIDRNGDGRLEASEYIRAAGGVLRRAGISSSAEQNHAAVALIQLDSNSLRERFERFRSAYSFCFRNGIEMPSNQDFGELALIGSNAAVATQAAPNLADELAVERAEIGKELCQLIEIERRRRAKAQAEAHVTY